jgi:hypothetical protein
VEALRSRLADVPAEAIDAEIEKVMARIDRITHAQIIAAWRDAFGIGRSVGIDTLASGDIPSGLETALLAVAAREDDRTIISNVGMGRWLRGRNGIAVDGLALQHMGSDRGNQLWALQTAAPEIAAKPGITAAPDAADASVSVDAVAAASVNAQSASAQPAPEPPSGKRCAQCNGEPDGKEQPFIREGKAIWLHQECVRFYCPSKTAAAAARAPSAPAQPAPAAISNPSQTVVSFPFMITAAMRRRLIALHYTPGAISRLTPQEAHEIINTQRYAR